MLNCFLVKDHLQDGSSIKQLQSSWLRFTHGSQGSHRLASIPGSSAWAEKKEPGTHCLRMLSSPRISRNLCRLLLYKRCLSLNTLCEEDDKGATKIPGKQKNTWLTQSLPLKFTDGFKRSNADSYRRGDIVFDLKIGRMCLRGSITMQCGISAGS